MNQTMIGILEASARKEMERIARESESSTSSMTSEEALGTSTSSSSSSSSCSEPGQEGSHVQVAMLKDAADFSQQEQPPQQQDLTR